MESNIQVIEYIKMFGILSGSGILFFSIVGELLKSTILTPFEDTVFIILGIQLIIISLNLKGEKT